MLAFEFNYPFIFLSFYFKNYLLANFDYINLVLTWKFFRTSSAIDHQPCFRQNICFRHIPAQIISTHITEPRKKVDDNWNSKGQVNCRHKVIWWVGVWDRHSNRDLTRVLDNCLTLSCASVFIGDNFLENKDLGRVALSPSFNFVWIITNHCLAMVCFCSREYLLI